MVGVTGLEPATSSPRTMRATKLRHTPINPCNLNQGCFRFLVHANNCNIK